MIEFGLQNGTVMKVIKPLYGVPEASTYWLNTYHTHHINKLSMMESTYDSCLLYTDGNDKGFGVVGLQTYDTLILANDIFATAKEKELKEAKLLAKNREKPTLNTPTRFNGGYIRLANDNSFFLSQERQCQCLCLVTVNKSVNLVSFRGKIKKAVTLKDQYIAQRACSAYIATVSQPKAAFDLSFAAQVINPKKEDARTLN